MSLSESNNNTDNAVLKHKDHAITSDTKHRILITTALHQDEW
jgi:hypothetical protein